MEQIIFPDESRDIICVLCSDLLKFLRTTCNSSTMNCVLSIGKLSATLSLRKEENLNQSAVGQYYREALCTNVIIPGVQLSIHVCIFNPHDWQGLLVCKFSDGFLCCIVPPLFMIKFLGIDIKSRFCYDDHGFGQRDWCFDSPRAFSGHSLPTLLWHCKVQGWHSFSSCGYFPVAISLI